MIAGTLGKVNDTVDEPFSSWIRDGLGYPAIEIKTSQQTHGETVAQAGMVAGRVEETRQQVSTSGDGDSVTIDVDREPEIVPIATGFAADPTGSGVLLAESVAANEELPFPFDVFSGQLGASVHRLEVDVESLHDAWDDGDALEVWMAGSDRNGSTMAYHGSADTSEIEPTIGLGFKRAWSGTTMKGVVYESGYVALYSARHPADGIQFIADELLPFTGRWDPEEHEEQTDFDEFGGA